MSKENSEKTSQKTSRDSSGAGVVVEITVITTRKPHGSMRFSRCRKVLQNKEIEREERDFIIYHIHPRVRAYWTPARVYARGMRLSREVFSCGIAARIPIPFTERNPMTLPSCFDCQFFTTLDDDTPAADLMPPDRERCLQGLCRRNPPAVGRFRGEDESLPYDYGQWPLVLSCDWCGSFRPWRIVPRTTTTPPVGPQGVTDDDVANHTERRATSRRREYATLAGE